MQKRGVDGEAKAALHKLDKFLKKYNITYEELTEDTIKKYKFFYENNEYFKLLIQCHASVCNVSTVSYYRFNNHNIEFSLTKLQYFQLRSLYDFHYINYTREKDRILKNMMNAYIGKHNIYSSVKSDKHDDSPQLSKEDIFFLISLQSTFSNTTYRKQLKS